MSKEWVLDILYEDADCFFVNKQAGISVHADGKTPETTLADLVLEKYPELAAVGEPLELQHGGQTIIVLKPGIVHRLDKETSGVILVAKNKPAYEFLKKQFQEREIQKIYHAFAYGWIKEDTMTIDAPIGREAGGIRRWTTGTNMRGESREAVTEVAVLKRFGDREYEGKGSTEEGTYSFIEARPKTGRTHQIRVHLKSVNHPIVADSLYAPKRKKVLGFERLALHARSLEVLLPSGGRQTVVAPYPQDFQKAMSLAF